MMYYKNKIFYGMNDKIFFLYIRQLHYKSKKNQRMSSEQEIQAFFLCSMLSFCRFSPPYLIFAKLYYTLNQKSESDWFRHFSR